MKQKLALLVLAWFRYWARLRIKSSDLKIVGITGSAGKSSTHALVALLLSQKFKVKVSKKANSESGIPLDILDLHPKNYSLYEWFKLLMLAPIKALNPINAEVYVVEMAIDSNKPPKNMEYLLTIIKPDVGIFLNALPVHGEGFLIEQNSIRQLADKTQSVAEMVAEEKGKLIQSVPANGTAVLNADDELVLKSQHNSKARLLTFGKSSADVQIKSWKLTKTATIFQFEIEQTLYELELPYFLPKHFGHSIAAALATAKVFDLKLEDCIAKLNSDFNIPPGRSSILAGVNQSTIIDSSYNASTIPVLDMLELLKELKSEGKKIAVLGDMRELGSVVKSEHEKIVTAALEVVDKLFLVGPLMQEYGMNAALNNGEGRTRWFADAAYAALEIPKSINKDDVVLIKGSQNGIMLEIVVEALLKSKKDRVKLCRRGEFWQRKREAIQKNIF